MKKIIDKLTDRLMSLFGLDFEMEWSSEQLSLITNDLYLGSRPKFGQNQYLKELGITHVISCLDPEKRPKVAFLDEDFQTLFLPVRDGINEDIASSFPALFNFVFGELNAFPEARFLVHCEVGVSRSATLILAILMKRQSLTFFDAFQAVRSKRAKILPNIGFASQLQLFENTLFSENLTSGKISSLAHYLHQICNVPVEIETLDTMLKSHNYTALSTIQAVFGEEIPRVIQGVRL